MFSICTQPGPNSVCMCACVCTFETFQILIIYSYLNSEKFAKTKCFSDLVCINTLSDAIISCIYIKYEIYECISSKLTVYTVYMKYIHNYIYKYV